MADRLYDSFNRNGTTTLSPLGVSDSGHAWVDLSNQGSAVGILQNRARFDTAASRVIAVLDAGPDGQDGSLSCSLVGQGGGLGLYFRVVDLDDWWRAYQRVYSYQYQTGTETYVSGYTQVFSHYENVVVGYTSTEYEWRQNYSTGVTHGYSDMYSLHSQTAWSTSSTSAPYFGSINHNHYLSGSYFPGDQEFHWHYASGSPYRTGATRGGQPIYEQRAVYTSQPIYSTRPIYATATGYDLRLERMAAGVLSTRASRQITGPFSKISVLLQGDKIDAYVSGHTTPVSTTDSAHQTATRHGIGLGSPSEGLSANSNFIDDFSFTPPFTGRLQPHVLL